MGIGIGFIVVGLIVIIITQRAIKQGKMQEKDKKAKRLNFMGSMLIAAAFPIWMYLLTDTLEEWMIATVLLFGAFGVNGVVTLVSNKLYVPRWSLPIIVVPLAGIACLALSYAIIPFTISKTSNALIIGIMTGLFCTVNQATKENKKYRIPMLAEVIVLYLIVLKMSNGLLPATKPIRLIGQELTMLEEKGVHFIISEDVESPRRGERALLRVFIERENGQLEEMRYYSYVEGHASVESIEKFNP